MSDREVTPGTTAVIAPSAASSSDAGPGPTRSVQPVPAVERLPVLDGIRGCAILMVIVWHYGHCLIVSTANLPPAHWAYKLMSWFNICWSGVDLFFVLSGYLIGGILIDNRDATNFFRIFYIRRILRIFPVYYASVLLFLVVGALGLPATYDFLFKNPLPTWSYLTFTQNLTMAYSTSFGPTWLDVTWSLAIEEQFYLIIPFVVWFFSRSTLYSIAAAIVLLAPLARMLWPGFGSFVGLPFRADALMLGVLLACAVRHPAFQRFCRNHRRAVFATWASLLAGVAVMILRNGGNFGALSFTWLAATYGGLILIGVTYTDSWVAWLVQCRFLVWLGQLSYFVYMAHQVVCGLLFATFAGKPPGINCANDAAITVAALALTLAGAELSYRFFEKPILGWGRRHVYLKPTAPTP